MSVDALSFAISVKRFSHRTIFPAAQRATGLGAVKAKPPRGAQCAALTAPRPGWRRGCHREEGPTRHRLTAVPVVTDRRRHDHQPSPDVHRWSGCTPPMLPSEWQPAQHLVLIQGSTFNCKAMALAIEKLSALLQWRSDDGDDCRTKPFPSRMVVRVGRGPKPEDARTMMGELA